MNIQKLGAAAVAMTLVSAPAMADVLYTMTNGVSDGATVAATVQLSVNRSGQLVVVVTNTSQNAVDDVSNISGISFNLTPEGSNTGLTSGSLASISGSTISSTPLNTNVTSLITANGASLATTPWTQSDPNNKVASLTAAGQFAWFATIGMEPSPLEAEYSIAAYASGTPPEYTTTGSCDAGGKNNCGTGQLYGANSSDDPMIYGQATFVFNLTGLTSNLQDQSTCTTAGETCVKSITLAWGPDGPDADDVTTLTYSGIVAGSSQQVPEPPTLAVLGMGLAGLWAARRRMVPRFKLPSFLSWST